jgi:hypothetical protein
LLQLLLDADDLVPGSEGLLLADTAPLLLALEAFFQGLDGNARRLELLLVLDDGRL